MPTGPEAVNHETVIALCRAMQWTAITTESSRNEQLLWIVVYLSNKG